MTDRLPWYFVAGMAACGIGSVIASGWTLATLAALLGWISWSVWLLPVCVDTLAGVCLLAWLSPRFTPQARSFARWVALVAIGASAAGNATSHILSGTGSRVVLTVIVSTAPPLALAAIVHLAVLVTAPVPRRTRRAAPARPEPDAPVERVDDTAPVAPPRLSAVEPVRTDELLTEVLALRSELGRPVTSYVVRKRFDVGTSRATKLARLANHAAEAA